MPKQVFLFAALFWTGIILFFCLIKSSDIPTVNIQNLDKVIHVFFHFVFVFLWFLYLKKRLNNASQYNLLLISLVSSFFFGIGIELMQQLFTITRQGDILDIVANLFGGLLAVIVIVVLTKLTRIVDKI